MREQGVCSGQRCWETPPPHLKIHGHTGTCHVRLGRVEHGLAVTSSVLPTVTLPGGSGALSSAQKWTPKCAALTPWPPHPDNSLHTPLLVPCPNMPPYVPPDSAVPSLCSLVSWSDGRVRVWNPLLPEGFLEMRDKCQWSGPGCCLPGLSVFSLT